MLFNQACRRAKGFHSFGGAPFRIHAGYHHLNYVESLIVPFQQQRLGIGNRKGMKKLPLRVSLPKKRLAGSVDKISAVAADADAEYSRGPRRLPQASSNKRT